MSFPTGMKITLALATALFATAVFAADPPKPAPAPDPAAEKLDKLVKDALPVCSVETKITTNDMQHKLPPNFTSKVYKIESERQSCEGMYVAILSAQGGFYLGVPWFLDDVEAKTIEARLKEFTWKNMQQNYEPVVDRTKTRDNLYRVVMNQTTERGKFPLEGEVDQDAKFFFLGHFNPATESAASIRLKAFAPYLPVSPTKGASNPAVTVIEFSDFECPSCKHAAHYLDPILEKHGDQVRYIRYDLPLINAHPWAFTAAVAGRAIYKQKPEVFWDFKQQIYSNQSQLSAFTIDDFCRNFAQDHELDLAKYDADIASAELQSQIMKGAATALSGDIRATPSYLVNGVLVDPGEEGKTLDSYVAGLLKK